MIESFTSAHVERRGLDQMNNLTRTFSRHGSFSPHALSRIPPLLFFAIPLSKTPGSINLDQPERVRNLSASRGFSAASRLVNPPIKKFTFSDP